MYFLSKKRVGIADIKVISFLGFYMGYPLIFSLLFASMFLAMIYGIALVVLKKAELKSEIPFLPFLLLGYIINVLNF